jgi:glycerol-3-phosphate dehydrogenase
MIARRAGLHEVRIEHLLNRYGSLAEEVLRLVEDDPALGEPLQGADDYLRAEVVYAASHEGARHLDDVLTRRTRISIESFDRGLGCCEDAARLMGGVLGWSSEQVDVEVEHYRQRVAAERESQQMPDDETADAARLGAPDVVPVSG